MYTTDNSISLSRDLKREMKAFLPLKDLVSYLSDKLDMSPEEELDSKNFLRCHNYYSFSAFIKQVPDNLHKGKFQCMNLMIGYHSFCLYFLVD